MGLQVRIAQSPAVVQRRAPPQSGSVVQESTQAAKEPQSVAPGQSAEEPQPLQTPPGAVVVQVDWPGQSALVRHCTVASGLVVARGRLMLALRPHHSPFPSLAA